MGYLREVMGAIGSVVYRSQADKQLDRQVDGLLYVLNEFQRLDLAIGYGAQSAPDQAPVYQLANRSNSKNVVNFPQNLPQGSRVILFSGETPRAVYVVTKDGTVFDCNNEEGQLELRGDVLEFTRQIGADNSRIKSGNFTDLGEHWSKGLV